MRLRCVNDEMSKKCLKFYYLFDLFLCHFVRPPVLPIRYVSAYWIELELELNQEVSPQNFYTVFTLTNDLFGFYDLCPNSYKYIGRRFHKFIQSILH